MKYKRTIILSAVLVMTGCDKLQRVSKLDCPSFMMEECTIQPTGIRRTTEWELRKDGSGRWMPQDAEDGYEFFVVQIDIEMPENVDKLSINLNDISAVSVDGSRYTWSLGSDLPSNFSISLYITIQREDGPKQSKELAVKVPEGTLLKTFSVAGNRIHIPVPGSNEMNRTEETVAIPIEQPPAKPTPTALPPELKEKLQLSGIAIRGNEHIAIINGELTRVGQTLLNEFEVSRIEKDYVEIRSADDIFLIRP